MSGAMHPVLPLLAGAVLAPFLPAMGRRVLGVLAPAVALALVLALPDGARLSLPALGHEWVLLRFDPLARVFALAFTGYAFAAGVYAWREEGRLFRFASLLLAGGGVGVTLAGDFWTLLFFWEWLTVGSLFLVWDRRTDRSYGAGYRYALLHIAGGMTLMAGIVMLTVEGEPLALSSLTLSSPATWLVLAGFATNAAVPPLHAWLPDAYPEASPAGTAFLAAFTTKAAVYALARVFPGTPLLVWVGAAMTIYGVTFAMLSNDIRRLLAYHIVSQVGYMVCGIGLGTAVAINGATAHAFNNICYKGLLMMAAGAVLHATGQSRLERLGGLAREMKAVVVLYMIGALSISGVPLFNGFISKSMTVYGAMKPGYEVAELVLLVASAGTFLCVGLKLPWFAFFARGASPKVERAVPRSMLLAMGLLAAVCIGTGVAPGALYAILPREYVYDPFTVDHVIQALQLLLATALVFTLLRAKLTPKAVRTADVDEVYRWGLPRLVSGAGASFQALGEFAGARTAAVLDWIPRSQAAAVERLRRTHASSHSTSMGIGFLLLAALVYFLRP